MNYESMTTQSPNPLQRWAHQKRIRTSLSLTQRYLPAKGVLLDFGCGTGVFLNFCASVLPRDGRLFGYEPFQQQSPVGYTVVPKLIDLPASSVDVITCLEVVEHLTSAEFDQLLQDVRRILAPGGFLIITCPIEIGPAVFVKELNRVARGRRLPEMNPLEWLLAGVFGIPARRALDVKSSHRGFDFRVVRKSFRESFSQVYSDWSPMPLPTWWGNSQAIMVFKNDRTIADHRERNT